MGKNIKMSRPASAATNTFATSTAPDGVILGRLNRRGDAPFGKPFAYTDALDLKTQIDDSKPWFKRLIQRYGKRPLGWIVVETNPGRLPQAYLSSDKELRVSPIEVARLIPVYDDNVILAMDAYERSQKGVG